MPKIWVATGIMAQTQVHLTYTLWPLHATRQDLPDASVQSQCRLNHTEYEATEKHQPHWSILYLKFGNFLSQFFCINFDCWTTPSKHYLILITEFLAPAHLALAPAPSLVAPQDRPSLYRWFDEIPATSFWASIRSPG